jgi:hypothetical protein
LEKSGRKIRPWIWVTRTLELLVLSHFHRGGGLSGPDLEKSGRKIRPWIWVTRTLELLVLSHFQGWPDYPAQFWPKIPTSLPAQKLW